VGSWPRVSRSQVAVGAVVGQGLAGPLAGDQHAASGVAEVVAAVGFAFAGAGDETGPGVLGLDAVAEPVGAARRARFDGTDLKPGNGHRAHFACRLHEWDDFGVSESRSGWLVQAAVTADRGDTMLDLVPLHNG